jgi:molybdopterin synthase sulfur carrier subunit
MTIQIRYFAALRERMGRSGESLVADRLNTVEDVWRAVAQGSPLPERTLCAVNMEYVQSGATVKDGDEVAFFPPVTGG